MMNLFLSGFIFMSMYNWLNNKKTDVTIITVWSLFISVLVQSFYSVVHNYILSNIAFSEALKILVFSFTGLLLAFIVTYFKKNNLVQSILYVFNNKSINSDIFDDIIDYKKRTMLKIYPKSSDIYYLGKFSFREEKGIDSWISLVEYCSVYKTNNQVADDPGVIKSSLVINLRDVEHLEIIYEDDSEVWKWLMEGKC